MAAQRIRFYRQAKGITQRALAEAMGVTAKKVHKAGLVDGIINEPLGGAHRNPDAMAASVKKKLVADLAKLQSHSLDSLIKMRYQRLMAYGVPK